MKFFVDSANISEIEKAHKLGILDGVTTNPSLIAKEGKDFAETIKKISAIVDGPVSAEVISLETEEMIEEAKELNSWADNIAVKIPMTLPGLRAVKKLSDEGIDTNVTLIFSASQALLAAKAGATFVSPFVGRLDDRSHQGLKIIEDIAKIFSVHDIETEIITASVRRPLHVKEAALAGADIATIPFEIIKKMAAHPLTDIGIERFLADWEEAQQD